MLYGKFTNHGNLCAVFLLCFAQKCTKYTNKKRKNEN